MSNVQVGLVRSEMLWYVPDEVNCLNCKHLYVCGKRLFLERDHCTNNAGVLTWIEEADHCADFMFSTNPRFDLENMS